MAQISVIVPVYKVEAYLDRCVESVLHQSFRDLELILVDDGSPDGSPALCDGYAAREPSVHVIHQKNGGLSAARNAGIEWALQNSDSRWIFFLDSDDWIHRDCLRRLMTGTADPEVGISACAFTPVSEQKKDPELGPEAPVYLAPEDAYEQHCGMFITACCKLIRKDYLRNLRFPLGKLHEDAFLTHEILFQARKVAVLQEDLYFYFFNPGSITRKPWNPKRLEQVEGHTLRLHYMQQHGLQKAAAVEQELLTTVIYEHTEALARPENRQYGSYLPGLRRQLRRELKACRGLGKYALNRENQWVYLMAYVGKTPWLWLQKLRAARRNRIDKP